MRGLAHRNPASREVDVLYPEPAHLASAEAGVRGEEDRQRVPRPPGGARHRLDLAYRQRLDLPLASLRRPLDPGLPERADREVPAEHGTVESLRQELPHVA